MVKGETTKRSDLDAERLTARLRERAVAQLAGEEEVWAIVDPSELRKPYAREMADLMRVRKLGGEGTAPGYRTLNVLGLGRGGRRGILYHRLFSSMAADFQSESLEIQAALTTVGAALAAHRGRVTYLMDTQFDDEAVWSTIWTSGNHLVCRLKHTERLVERPLADGGWEMVAIADAQAQLRELAQLETELLVRKRGQRAPKRQPVTATLRACPLRVHVPLDVRSRRTSPRRSQAVWLVQVQLANVDAEPWLLLTDWPVATAAEAARIFRMYRQRWAVEDCFKFTKAALGWEDVQLLGFEAIRTLVALGWVAAGFLYELGVTLEWPEVRLLARLGGWVPHKDRPPGKTVIARGLRRLLDHWATEAMLTDEIARHARLPPRLAALLGGPAEPDAEL
jgi:hypothetical protein